MVRSKWGMIFMQRRHAVIATVLQLAVLVPSLFAQGLGDGYQQALKVVASRLSNPRLISARGAPAFDASGRQTGEVFFNFCGQDAGGEWMLVALTLRPDGSLADEGGAEPPRPDHYGHHLKRPVLLDAWVPPEELVPVALRLHAGHPTSDEISLAYYTSREYGGRTIIVLYWEAGGVIHDAVFDARYGDVLSVEDTPWEDRARVRAHVGRP